MFYENTCKSLENKFNEEIKKLRNVCDQTTKALEGKIKKERKKEMKVISDKLENNK
jgi:hypothetical protein